MRYLFFACTVLFFACENAVPPEARADKLAKSLCNCSTPLFTANKEAQANMDSLAFRKIEQAYNKAKNCALALDIKAEEKAAMELALQGICPELAANKDLIQELITQ